MFVELIEFLECVEAHEHSFLVVTPDRRVGRSIIAGDIGCPKCRRQYSIADGVADFRPPNAADRHRPSPQETPPPPDVLQALIGLTGSGGFVVLIGSAARHAPDLSALIEGVHFVGVNATADVTPSPSHSLVRGADRIPLRSSMARAVVVGAEYADDVWLAEAVRVLLRGLRLVILAEGPEPTGVRRLAVGDGLWVGEKQ